MMYCTVVWRSASRLRPLLSQLSKFLNIKPFKKNISCQHVFTHPQDLTSWQFSPICAIRTSRNLVPQPTFACQPDGNCPSVLALYTYVASDSWWAWACVFKQSNISLAFSPIIPDLQWRYAPVVDADVTEHCGEMSSGKCPIDWWNWRRATWLPHAKWDV